MPTLGSSSPATGNGTSVVLNLSPVQGDLMVAIIATDNPRNVIPPNNYAPNVADSWVPLWRAQPRTPDGDGSRLLNLWAFYKTANATDATQTSFTFTSSYASDPSNQGANWPTFNYAAQGLIIKPSAGGSAGLDSSSPQEYLDDTRKTFQLPLLTAGGASGWITATAGITATTQAATATINDGAATSLSANQDDGTINLNLFVFLNLSSATKTYQKSLTWVPNRPLSGVVAGVFALRDALSNWTFTAPFVREGIPSMAPTRSLFERFPYHQGFTVVNNSGTYSATRFFSQDQLAAATAYYTQSTAVSSATRNALLTAAVGGDFLPVN